MAKLLTLRNRRPQEIAIIICIRLKTASTSSLLSVAACPNTTTTTSEYLQKEKNVVKREPERVSLLKEDFGYLRVQLFRMHGEKFGTETRTFCLRAFYTNVLSTTYKLSTGACNSTEF